MSVTTLRRDMRAHQRRLWLKAAQPWQAKVLEFRLASNLVPYCKNFMHRYLETLKVNHTIAFWSMRESNFDLTFHVLGEDCKVRCHFRLQDFDMQVAF